MTAGAGPAGGPSGGTDLASPSEFDVVIVGAGTGGYATALRAAGLGLEVALVEADLVGGTCLHRGCIPSKALLHAAELAEGVTEGRERFGIDARVRGVDAAMLAAARDDIVERNYRGLLDHLAHDGVHVVAGRGRLVGPRTVVVSPVEDRAAGGPEPLREPVTLRARRGVVVATGSRPRLLSGLEPDGERILTSDAATRATRLPRSVVIVGAGAIGVEFASFYHGVGTEVTIVEALPQVLAGEDPDVSREMARALRRKGIGVHTNARVENVRTSSDGVVVTIVTAGETVAAPRGGQAAGGEATTMELRAEQLLLAIGREPVSEGLGLEDLGVTIDRGYVVPRSWDRLETAVPGVHVVGDLLPPPSLALAHASFAEGLLVAETLAGSPPAPLPPAPIDYAFVPRATYSLPEAASVGLSEPAARERGHDVVVNRMPLTAVAKGLIYGQGGLVKVVADADGTVLGVHLVGPRVTELIAEGMLISAWAAYASEVAEWIHPHPSLSEAIGEVHLTLAGRRLHQQGR